MGKLLLGGNALVTGPVQDPNGTYGFAIVFADSEDAVRELLKNDPAQKLSSANGNPILIETIRRNTYAKGPIIDSYHAGGHAEGASWFRLSIAALFILSCDAFNYQFLDAYFSMWSYFHYIRSITKIVSAKAQQRICMSEYLASSSLLR